MGHHKNSSHSNRNKVNYEEDLSKLSIEEIIMKILNGEITLDDIEDDELTKGRIRTIYVSLNYGSKTAKELSEYYDIPVQAVKDIGSGKLFGSITRDIS